MEGGSGGVRSGAQPQPTVNPKHTEPHPIEYRSYSRESLVWDGTASAMTSHGRRVRLLCAATNPNPNDLSIPLGCQRAMMQAYAS